MGKGEYTSHLRNPFAWIFSAAPSRALAEENSAPNPNRDEEERLTREPLWMRQERAASLPRDELDRVGRPVE